MPGFTSSGTQLLEGLPKDAILLTLGDLPGNAARYVSTSAPFHHAHTQALAMRCN